MTDQVPEQPADAAAQQNQSSDWQARYNGQQVKLQQQAATIQQLSTQIAALQQQISDMTAQLSVKDGERSNALGQKDQTIQSLTQEKATLQTQVAQLQGQVAKLEVVKKLGRPELINVMDAIPASDPAAMEQAFAAMTRFADSLVQAREQQLTAGVTTTGGGASSVPTQSLPNSSADWEKHVNSLPLGSSERAKAMDQWYAWSRKPIS